MSFKRKMFSVNGLVTFEAALRLRSFTLAARELGVTQAAVSRQVRLLETELGVALFKRAHRRVEPTAPGAVLGATLGQSFATIIDAIEMIRRPADTDTLTVGTTVAFSHFWLVPRLSWFRQMHPDFNIRLIAQDNTFDLRTDNVDVVLRYGIPPFEDGRVAASISDKVSAVCSPEFAARLPATFEPPDLRTVPLISNDVIESSWIDWADWFHMAGIRDRAPRSRLQFNHYTDCITAALAGEGVALGWHMFVEDLLTSGALVTLTDRSVLPKETYNAVVREDRPAGPAVESFVRWFRSILEYKADRK